jgi:hypothetical protein
VSGGRPSRAGNGWRLFRLAPERHQRIVVGHALQRAVIDNIAVSLPSGACYWSRLGRALYWMARLVPTNPAPRRWNLHDDCGVGYGARLRSALEVEPKIRCLVHLDRRSSSDRRGGGYRGGPTALEKALTKIGRTSAPGQSDPGVKHYVPRA